MRRWFWIVTVVALLAANAGLARAHDWWYWTWAGRSDMTVFESVKHEMAAEAARKDWAAPHTHLSLTLSPKHADISIIEGDYDATQWWGLATVESQGRSWPQLCGGSPFGCRFVHAHARYNAFYDKLKAGPGADSDIRGVFCQEIGHTLGLTHSDTQDCMGKHYFKGNDINVVGSHAEMDVNARYH